MTDVKTIYSTGYAFAAHFMNGHVETWGHSLYGGDSRHVQGYLQNVNTIYASDRAFAAHLMDGHVITWGDPTCGGESKRVQPLLQDNVVTIYPNKAGFAAKLRDGTIVMWGGINAIIPISVDKIYSTDRNYFVITTDNNMTIWGNMPNGYVEFPKKINKSNIKSIYTNSGAYFAIGYTGSGFTWGIREYGAGQRFVNNIKTIYPVRYGFIVNLIDNTFVFIGKNDGIGDFKEIERELKKGVINIYSTEDAYVAHLSNGTIVTWGNREHGGDYNLHRYAKRITHAITTTSNIVSAAYDRAASSSVGRVLAEIGDIMPRDSNRWP